MKKNFNQLINKLTYSARSLNNKAIKDSFSELKKYYHKTQTLKYEKNFKSGYWKNPPQWEVKSGILYDPKGNVIANYIRNPLELWTHSTSFSGYIKKEDLIKNHIFTDKNRPGSTPFHFKNQYRENLSEWGFCLPYNLVKKLKKGKYKVNIKTNFSKSELQSAYLEKKGKNKNTILFVSHFDHPYQINDGLSGTLTSFELLNKIKNLKLSYASLATPEIIGSIFFAKKFALKKNIKHALMLNFCGVDNNLVYSKTSDGNTFFDKIISHLFTYKKNSKIVRFREIIGADEIAFDNQIYKVPCGSMYRWPFKHYHSDKDDLKNFNLKKIEDTINFLEEVIFIIENNSTFKNTFKDFPKLSHPKLDLYFSPRYWRSNKLLHDEKTFSISNNKINYLLSAIKDQEIKKACWKSADNIQLLQSLIPTKCDGKFTTLELANLCNMPFRMVDAMLNLWSEKKLIKKTWINPIR